MNEKNIGHLMAERWNLNKMDKTSIFENPLGFKRVKPHCMRDLFFLFSLCVIFYFDASLWQANANLALGIGNLRAAASWIFIRGWMAGVVGGDIYFL